MGVGEPRSVTALRRSPTSAGSISHESAIAPSMRCASSSVDALAISR